MFFKTESGSTYTVDPERKTVMGPGTGDREVPYVAMSSVLTHSPVVFRLVIDGAIKVMTTSSVVWSHA